jgi:alpha-ketoglutarate-dependent taurine dioxygenase
MRFLAEVRERSDRTAAEVVHEALAEHKVVVCRRNTGTDSEEFYRRIAEEIGEFHFRDEDPASGELDRPGWLDVRYDPELEASSEYRYGNGRMPLHVDGAYSDVEFDVFFMYCATAARFGGATFAVDGELVVSYLAAYDPSLLQMLQKTMVTFAKGERSITSTILGSQDGEPAFNWSSTRIDPGNPPSVLDMCARFDDFCEHRLVDGGLVTPIGLAPGDAVFVHNRKVLHGRYSFWGERCMLKGVLNLRPLRTRQLQS